MPLRFITFIAFCALTLGALGGWTVRAWAEGSNQDVGSEVKLSDVADHFGSSPSSGPAFSPELLSAESYAAGAWVQRSAEERLWNATVVIAEAERNKIAVVGGEPGVVRRPQTQTGPPGPASSGDCGGATNGADAYIQRESGGDPNAVNPSSGARGCWQLMPMHFGAGGTCADLQPGPDDAACASRLPLSAWG